MTDKHLDLEPDPLPDAIEHLIAVALDSRQYIAFPARRLQLNDAAESVKRLMKEKAS